MNQLSVSGLADQLRMWAQEVGPHVPLVVGIPRRTVVAFAIEQMPSDWQSRFMALDAILFGRFKTRIVGRRWHVLKPGSILKVALGLVLEDFDPKRIAEDCARLSGFGEATGSLFTSLFGVQVTETVNLAPGVDIIPSTQLPTVTQRDLIHRWRSGSFAPEIEQMPDAVIAMKFPFSRVLRESALEETAPAEFDRDGQEEIAAACAIANSTPVLASTIRAGFDNLVWDGAVGSRKTLRGRPEDLIAHRMRPAPVMDGPKTRAALDQIKAFQVDEKPTLMTAIRRYHRALMPGSFVDRAIDMGIALELLLLHKCEQNELTFQLRTRGARLLASDPAGREAVFNTLKKAYDLRSTAVHQGVFRGKPEDLDRAIETTRSVLVAVLSRGQLLGKNYLLE